jgi:hypothetical protein
MVLGRGPHQNIKKPNVKLVDEDYGYRSLLKQYKGFKMSCICDQMDGK